MKAAEKEVKQLHDRESWRPVRRSELTKSELERTVDAMLLLAQKPDGSIKGRKVYNGKPTHAWVLKENAASPTVSNEALFLTITIDANEDQDVMLADIPNAFVQTKLERKKLGECIIMHLTGKDG